MANKYTPNEVQTVPQLNVELQRIQQVLRDVLYRDQNTNNQLESELDMNGYRGINGKAPVYDTDLVTKKYVDGLLAGVSNLVPSATTVTETEALSSGQLVVTFGTVNPTEAILYIGGPNIDNKRLFTPQDYTVTDTDEITLTESYPTDSVVYAIQETE